MPARLQLAAFACLSILPFGMAVANRSAPAIVVLSALLSIAGRTAEGGLPQVYGRLRKAILSRAGIALLLFLALATASVGWSFAPRISLRMLGELVLAAGAAFVLHGSLPRDVPRGIVLVATIAAIAGCLWAMAELATDVSARAALGFRSETFIFKRSVTAILMVAWPVAAMAWLTGLRWAAPGLAIALLAAILAAHAGAALVGLAVGGAFFAQAILGRRSIALVLLAGLVFGALATAPVFGEITGRLLPGRALDALHSVQARERVDIWRSFGEVVRRRPLLGTGFGTSGAMERAPVADEVPAERRTLLAVGHPHHGFLQIWAELGLAGALLAGVILAVLVGGIRRSPAATALPAIAATACAAVIMLVAHGAWQGWWVASLGAAAVWLLRVPSTGAYAARKPVAST